MKIPGKTEQESTAKLLSKSQFGLELKNLYDPTQSQFHMVALHHGPLDKGTSLPLVNFYDHIRLEHARNPMEAYKAIMLSAIETATGQPTIHQDIIRSFVNTCQRTMQTDEPSFTPAFSMFFDHLLADPCARITFHVFDMAHVTQLDKLLQTYKHVLYMTHFTQDTPYYVPFDVARDDEPKPMCILDMFSTSSSSNNSQQRLRYDQPSHVSQSLLYLCQHESCAIHVFREDYERYKEYGSQSSRGKHGICTFQWIMLFKITRWVVFDDDACWNLSPLQGKFVHVNPISAVNTTSWFMTYGKQPSVFCAIGFWNLSFMLATVIWLTYQIFGLWTLLVYSCLLYFVIDEGRKQNMREYTFWVAITHCIFLLPNYF